MKKLLLLSFAFLSLASCSSDDDTKVEIPTVGATLQPSVGGPNQPSQVYLDLSAAEFKAVNRESWDFGFSSGDDFRVVLNGSVKMAVKKLTTSDITVSQTIDTNVSVGNGETTASNGYVDNPTGVF